MDVDSLRASKGRPCPSYEAMRSAIEAMTDIITKPDKMRASPPSIVFSIESPALYKRAVLLFQYYFGCGIAST